MSLMGLNSLIELESARRDGSRTTAGAAIDCFLKLDGIEGESTDTKHKGEIDLQSFQFGESNFASVATGGGGGAGKVAISEAVCTSSLSKASNLLFLACATGQHIKSATVVFRKAGGAQMEYYKIVMTDVLVSSWSFSGQGSGGAVPREMFSLAFGKIELEYKEQKSDGAVAAPVKTGYDVKANKKV